MFLMRTGSLRIRDQDIALFFKSTNCKDPQIANEAIKRGKLKIIQGVA